MGGDQAFSSPLEPSRRWECGSSLCRRANGRTPNTASIGVFRSRCPPVELHEVLSTSKFFRGQIPWLRSPVAVTGRKASLPGHVGKLHGIAGET
jgi:hypothetical protein